MPYGLLTQQLLIAFLVGFVLFLIYTFIWWGIKIIISVIQSRKAKLNPQEEPITINPPSEIFKEVKKKMDLESRRMVNAQLNPKEEKN